MRNPIDHYLLKRSPRYRLWRICRAIGIKPHKWQKEFALAPVVHLIPDRGRCTGKTMAVMLRLLVHPTSSAFILATTLCADPDYYPHRHRWYLWEYKRLRDMCDAKGIYNADTLTDGYRIWFSAVDDTNR